MSNAEKAALAQAAAQKGASPPELAARRLKKRRQVRSAVKSQAGDGQSALAKEQAELRPTQKRARGGRPRKDPWEKRDRVLRAKVSGPEYDIIEAKAAKAGMSFSQYLREMAIKGRVTVRKSISNKSSQDRDLVLQGIRAGGLLNQVAKKLNSRNSYIPRDLAAALKANKQWMKSIKTMDDGGK